MYLRISQEKKGENIETLDNHRRMLTEYAEAKGYTYERFEEVLSGGKSELEQRPQLFRLLKNIEKFDAILVVELTRLSRNGKVSQTIKQECMDYDKPILTPYDMYDLANSENDRLNYDFGSLISSHEHGTIGKRSKNNKIQMSKQGMHVSGNVPMGYRRSDKTKKLEIHEPEAKTIRYIFELHSQGLGAFKIRKILNNEGYKSATGKAFNLPSVKRIIKNEAYKGTIVFNDMKRVKRNGKFTHEILDTVRVENAHPAIILPEVWESVNRDRVERAERARITREKPAIKTGVTMLKDLIVCAECGCKMSIRKDNKMKMHTIKRCEYYLPNGKKCENCGIKLEYVEEDVLRKLLNHKEELEEYLSTLESEDNSALEAEQQHVLDQLEKHLKEVEYQQKELINLALSGVFTHNEIKEKKQELLNQKQQLERQHEKLMNEMNTISVEDVKEKIKGMVKTIERIADVEDTEIKNEIMKTIIKKIYYSRVIPEELLKKSTRNPERKNYPFQLKIEYY